ncbi:hypothetical protein MMC18_007640 [Xylographa bjoerkii]|nr:hypothetical protein [Xylographa bjoerkii]
MAINKKDKGKAKAKSGHKPNPKNDKKPKPQLDRKFICANCGKGYTRRDTIKDPHFPSCVKRNGNPFNVAWNDHPSCWLGQRGREANQPRTEFKIFDEEDEEMSGCAAEESSVAGEYDEDDEVMDAASGYYEEEGEEEEEEDAEMVDVGAYSLMSREQRQGIETHVRDGRPLEERSVDWLFPFEDHVIGEDGYILPSVFSVHGEDSNSHVHRSVVPSHLVHPGLAYGMNDQTSDPVSPPNAPQVSEYPELMESNELPPNFFIASSLPGAPYYGQTRRSPYDQAYHRQTAMASSDTLHNTDAVENDNVGELHSNLQTEQSHELRVHSNPHTGESHGSRFSNFQTEASHVSGTHSNSYAEESHGSRLSNRQTDASHRTHLNSHAEESHGSRNVSSLQTGESHGFHIHSNIQKPKSNESRVDPALFFSDTVSKAGTNLHHDRNTRQRAPYLPYFEQKAKNPESNKAFTKRMQDVKDEMLARLHAHPGHVPSAADAELVNQLFKCGQHDEASKNVVADYRQALKHSLRSTTGADSSPAAGSSILAELPIHPGPSKPPGPYVPPPTLDGSDIEESSEEDDEEIRARDNAGNQNANKPGNMIAQGTMNRIAAIAILAGRKGAAEDVFSAQVIWGKWHDLLPSGTTSNVARPTIDDSIKDRQLKVVQIGQAAIEGMHKGATNLKRQVEVTKKLRQLLYFLNEDQEVQKIRGMLMEDLVERRLVPAVKAFAADFGYFPVDQDLTADSNLRLSYGTNSDVIRPTYEDSIKDRQMKVVQMAQRSNEAMYQGAANVVAQMGVGTKTRRVLYFVNEDEAVK